MDLNAANHESALAKGLGILIGEWLFGLNAPFLFCRFGMNVPVATVAGVLCGAAIGYGVATAVWRIRHRPPVPHGPAFPIPSGAHQGAGLRA